MMHKLKEIPRPAMIAAALVAVVAGVHFQQYTDFMSQVPTVGVLFLLNAAGGAGLCLALLSREVRLRALAAVGSAGLAGGSLISIFIALVGNFAGYSEPTLRVPIVIAVVSELALLPVVGVMALGYLRTLRHPAAVPATAG